MKQANKVTLEFSDSGWVELGNDLAEGDAPILTNLEQMSQQHDAKWSRNVTNGPVMGPGRGGLHHPGNLFTILTTEHVSIGLLLGSACTFIKLARPLLEQWIKNKAGRSISLKKGDIEIKINGSHDLDKAIEALSTLEKLGPRTQKRRQGKRTHRGNDTKGGQTSI